MRREGPRPITPAAMASLRRIAAITLGAAYIVSSQPGRSVPSDPSIAARCALPHLNFPGAATMGSAQHLKLGGYYPVTGAPRLTGALL